MLRLATPQDANATEAFLARYPETSMFLRSNLATFGTQERTHKLGTAFYLWEIDGQIAAVFGITNAGFLLCQAPGSQAAAYHAFAQAIAGREVSVMTCNAAQGALLSGALGLDTAPATLDHDEPLYRMALADLPRFEGQARPAEPGDIPILTKWFAGYLTDTGLSNAETAAAVAGDRAKAAVGGPVRLLIEAGAPVAMVAINAQVGDIVQVGGVYTPPELRGNGAAKRATAALLQEARSRGATRAVLFANNRPAARAYEAIGFVQAGAYRVKVLERPVTIGKTPS